MPSAAAENGLQRPVGDSACTLLMNTDSSGLARTLTPPASAVSASPLARLRQARCTATSDEEQAVFTASAGPCRPRV